MVERLGLFALPPYQEQFGAATHSWSNPFSFVVAFGTPGDIARFNNVLVHFVKSRCATTFGNSKDQ
jgi:hypothetical protein